MFFHPPRRHEIEIVEMHLSHGNNLNFIDDVKNPTAIFWYLICFLKNIDTDLVGAFKELIDEWHEYVPTKNDVNKIIYRQNLDKFHQTKLHKTKLEFQTLLKYFVLI